MAESAADAVLLMQQLLLEKSLCTGNVFRKKPNTYILSASARHSPGEQSFLKPLISASQLQCLGFRKLAVPGLGGAGQLRVARAAPRAEREDWER